jgi:hypothetical protein
LTNKELVEKINKILNTDDIFTYDETENGVAVDGFISLDIFRQIADLFKEVDTG